MNPYEWPWENHPVEEDWAHRATARLRKKVRKLSRRVSRMDRELRKMRKALQRLAAASPPPPQRPPVSDLTLRLVGEAQRAAASYSTTRSARAAQEVTRTREALLRHVATLEAGGSTPRDPVSPTVQSPAAPPSGAPPSPPAPFPAAEGSTAPLRPSPPPSGGAAPAPESVLRWMRDAVSLLRAAAFSSEGHGILRDQLTEQALSFMAQRPRVDARPQVAPSPRGGTEERAPIGRPRLGGAPLAPPVPPSMASRGSVRTPEPVEPPARPAPTYREADPGGEEFPHSPPGGMAEAPVDQGSWDSPPPTPSDPPAEGEWPGAHPNGDAGAGEVQPAPDGSAEEDESGPRRWWSYAPIPPRPEE